MSLILRYLAKTSVPVEAECLAPDRLRERSLAEIERLEVFHGNRTVPLAEFFAISGDPSDAQMEIEGDLSGVHWVGTKMAGGSIHIQGNAGRHLGSEMAGGEIRVEGDAGDWVGGEMHDGLIHVRGRAGHLIGAAYRGSRRGMTGGTILIGGDAGNEIGSAMRRGILAVGGGCGDAAGFGMIAGTILVLGECGLRPGVGMKRGTLGLLGPNPTKLVPTFRFACRYRPPFLRLLLRELAGLGFRIDLHLADCDLLLYRGDMVALGKGEVWMRAS
jgi:formylmethanofuran dehydrogenase subunit C